MLWKGLFRGQMRLYKQLSTIVLWGWLCAEKVFDWKNICDLSLSFVLVKISLYLSKFSLSFLLKFLFGPLSRISVPWTPVKAAIKRLSLGRLMTSAIDFILSLASKFEDGIEASIKWSCVAQLATSAIESIESTQKPVPWSFGSFLQHSTFKGSTLGNKKEKVHKYYISQGLFKSCRNGPINIDNYDDYAGFNFSSSPYLLRKVALKNSYYKKIGIRTEKKFALERK